MRRTLIPFPRFPRAHLSSALLALVAAASTTSCMNGPYDGDVVGGTTTGASFEFSGYYDSPGITISIQVLDDPDSPTPTWRTLTTAVTSSTAGYYPATSQPYYQWSTTATPAPSGSLERWPQGGLVRVRSVADDPKGHGSNFVLYVTDEDADTCFQQNESDTWEGIVLACGKDPTHGAAIASNNPTPADVFAGHTVPSYLSYAQYTGPGTPSAQQTETLAYYKAINAPATLGAFQSEYGFNATGANLANATYYNDGDLGIGRDMHCVSNSAGISCYVRNFAPTDASGNVIFGDQTDALDLATNGGAPFATVAMHFTSPGTQANGVTFMVYDANNNLKSDKAVLDDKEANTDIPGNCLTCHNGEARYDSTTHAVNGGAHFLAFDVFNSLKFGTGQYSYASQADEFRNLNSMVLAAGAPPGIAAYIQGTYNNAVGVAGTPAVNTYIPPGWQGSQVEEKLYTSVVAPYCRTCHIAQATPANGHDFRDWTLYSDFANDSAAIGPLVCATHVMPNAEHTTRNFWNSSARAHLTGTLGIPGTCNPQ